MFSFLKRFSIVQISTFSLILFLSALIVLSSLNLLDNWRGYQLSQQDEKIIRLLDKFEKVAHHHAVERGLTAGYLGNPQDSGKSKLQQQRNQADHARNDLMSALASPWLKDLNVQVFYQSLTEHMQQKKRIRAQVDALQGSAAFDYYSRLNRLAIDAGQNVQARIGDAELNEGLRAAFLLARFKERAGQVRGKVNGILARGELSLASQLILKTYLSDLELIQSYLGVQLVGEQKQRFEQAVNSQNGKELAAITTVLTGESSPDFSSLPDASRWFTMATAQISDVKSILDIQWQDIYELAQSHETEAFWWLIVVAVLILSVAVVLVMLNYHLIHSLRFQLRYLTTSLGTVADKGDLTVKVELDSHDELGDISRVLQTTFSSFKSVLADIANSVNSSTRLNGELHQISTCVVEGAESTQTRATNIARAVEEMSQTSGDIARSATLTLEASDALRNCSDKTFAVSERTGQAIQTLQDNMQEVEQRAGVMEQQVADISGILETINNVAEQTNLLALNAAIEAARAGEHGRGFAVVADEVRNLAKGSHESSVQISGLLEELQSASNLVVGAISDNTARVSQTLQQVLEAQHISQELKQQAAEVESLSTQVSTAAEQQSVTTKQIAVDASQVMEAADQELEAVNGMRNILADVESNADSLQHSMSGFVIADKA